MSVVCTLLASTCDRNNNPVIIIEMSRKTLYNRTHDLEYGLKVAERDPVSTEVVSVCCQFCVFFGREEKVGAKRKPAA